MSLPEVTQQPIIYVDATPNGGYVLRILQAYRQNCNCKWADTSSPNETQNPLLVMMNETNDKRARLLDKSIALLGDEFGLVDFEPEVEP